MSDSDDSDASLGPNFSPETSPFKHSPVTSPTHDSPVSDSSEQPTRKRKHYEMDSVS